MHESACARPELLSSSLKASVHLYLGFHWGIFCGFLSCLAISQAVRMLDIEARVVPRSETKKKIQLLSPATLIQEKVLVGDTDMPQALQAHAVRAASEALDMHEVTDFKEIAYYIKNQFDKAYGSGWQCVTGVTFGSFVTHSSGTFIHFCLGRLAVMLFKAAS